MGKAQNIADTVKWKKKRKNHNGDLCNRADCGICAAHKTIGNSKKMDKRKHRVESDILKEVKNEF